MLIGNRVRVKSSGLARGWQMLGPRAAQNLLMPHPRDWQGGQMPRSSPGGSWAQLELTDALEERPQDKLLLCKIIFAKHFF